MTDTPKGCGAPATRVVFRGSTRRLWLCPTCVYAGRGRVERYETEVDGKEKTPGVFRGAAKKCGDTAGEPPAAESW